MPLPFTRPLHFINEYFALLCLCVLLVGLWALDQINLLTAIVILSLVASFFLRLRRRNEREILNYRQNAFQVHRESNKGVHSVRAQALEGLPSPILLLDAAHKIIFANEAARGLLGKSLLGEDAFLFLRQPSLVAQIDAALKNTIAPNIATTSGLENDADKSADHDFSPIADYRSDPLSHNNNEAETIRFATSDERHFDVTIAPITASSFAPEAANAPVIAEKNQPERQVMIFFYEVTSLLNSERMRVDFVANASHELRTPLTALLGSIETLQGPAQDDKEAQSRFLAIMQKEAERMTRLIDDLLSLSRIELARHKSPSNRVNMAELSHEAIALTEKTAAERGIRLSNEIHKELPPILADRDQLLQVFLNLLINAGKYADPHTTVHIQAELSKTKDSVIFTIRDEGPGIAPEHLARLTERFYRVDTARSRKMGGTGLGLAIVKHILLRHHSNLDIKSSLGEGTRFSFRLKTA